MKLRQSGSGRSLNYQVESSLFGYVPNGCRGPNQNTNLWSLQTDYQVVEVWFRPRKSKGLDLSWTVPF